MPYEPSDTIGALPDAELATLLDEPWNGRIATITARGLALRGAGLVRIRARPPRLAGGGPRAGPVDRPHPCQPARGLPRGQRSPRPAH